MPKAPSKLLAISCTIFTMLFFLHNHSAYLKIGVDHREIDSGFGVFLSPQKNIGYIFKEFLPIIDIFSLFSIFFLPSVYLFSLISGQFDIAG